MNKLSSPILYVGDIHGQGFYLSNIDKGAIRMGVKTIIQVGDWGVFWPRKNNQPDPIVNYFNKRGRKGLHLSGIGKVAPEDCPRWIVCPGNHDNYDVLDKMWKDSGYEDVFNILPGCDVAARGAFVNVDGLDHLFMGGATSVDKHHRIEGLSWWEREVPNKMEFDKFYDGLLKEPDVVVSHEAPNRVPVYRTGRYNDPVNQGLEAALKVSGYMPPRWYFGHHHKLERWYLGTQFFCCGYHGQFQMLTPDMWEQNS